MTTTEPTEYILVVTIGSHGHWGRGATEDEAIKAMPKCGCAKKQTVEIWRCFGTSENAPYVDDFGRMYSYGDKEPELLGTRGPKTRRRRS